MKRNFINLFSSTARVLALGVVLMLAVLKVNAQAVVTATGAGPGPVSYATLRLAFNAINAGTHTGAITITIGAAGTNEGGTPAVLNQNALPASYTSVLIKPAASTTPTIQGSIANDAVIYLFGASNVTIDGSNTAAGTTKDLTIRNTVFVQNSSVIRFGSPSATVGATSNTVKNCLISQQGNIYGTAIIAGSGVTYGQAAEAPNSNNTIQNNTISSALVGIYAFGVNLPAPVVDNNWLITGNNLNTLGFTGIHLNNSGNARIIDNIIDNVVINGTTQASGITLSFLGQNATIAGNKINNVSNTYFGVAAGTPSAVGIFLSVMTGSTNIDVYNNFISNVTGYSNPNVVTNGHGILHNFAGTANIYYNSIKMTSDQVLGTGITSAICIGPGVSVPCNVRNNIIEMAQTTGTRYTIYSAVASGLFASIDYNDYVPSSAGSVMGFLGGPRANLAAMIAGFGGNINSISVTPSFVSLSDLHLQLIPANNGLVLAAPILAPPISTDIDTANRSTTIPTMGAHELLSKITYTPLVNTCSDAAITLNAVTVLSPSGIPTVGGNVPRIYFRKGLGTWFSSGGIFVSGTANSSQWKFVIDPATLSGVTAGDVISYYVIGQTTGGTVFATPGSGLVATDVNTVTTHPTSPNSYTVNAVTLTGLVTTHNMCFNSVSGATIPYNFTGTTGSPNQYTLTWSPAGPTDIPAFTALPAGAINAVVPAALPPFPAPYYGTVTIKNSTSGCTKTYTIALIVDTLPATITGSGVVCQGSSTTLSCPGGGTWSTGTPAVASVGLSSGVVTGLSGGTANIIYTLPTGCSTFTTINVVPPAGPITGATAVCVNATTTLANSSPGGTWTSVNSGVATVNPSTGVVSGITADTTTIKYTLPGCTAVTVLMTVNDNPKPIVGTLYTCVGFSTTLRDTTVGGTWISASPALATIGTTSVTGGVSYAQVNGIASGNAVITYKLTSTGCFITNTVNVMLSPGPITGGNVVCIGLTLALSNSVPGGTWVSTNPLRVTINAAGVATGNTAGTSLISYTLPTGCYSTLPVSVNTPPTAIAGSHVFCSDYSITLTNGTSGGTWSSSSTAIATVGSSTGVVFGVTGGTATISYNIPFCNSAIYAVTVNQTPPPITGVTTLCDGGSNTTLYNATPGGVWTISGGGSISPTGVVTGLGFGTGPVVTYTMPNACFVQAPITVDTLPAPITGIDSVCPGRTDTLHTAAVGGIWSSNNATIASIGATNGAVTGVAFGSTVITYAALSGCYRTKPFRVTNPLPASVTITRNPAMDTLCSGIPVTFTAHHVNGGMAPGYQWQLFGVNIGPDDSVYTYTPTHGDVISCYMSNSLDICSSPTPAYYNIPINVYPNVVPVIAISTTAADTINYLGQVATFNAVVTSGGTAPAYQWYVDGDMIPGATNNTFVRTVYDNDTVWCQVNGNPPCELGSVGTSNSIVIYGDWLTTKSINGIAGTLSLFPNPNTGDFTLNGNTGSNATEELSIQILNVLGQVVFNGTTTAKNGAINYQISLSDKVAAGTYVLHVNGNTASQVFHFVIGE